MYVQKKIRVGYLEIFFRGGPISRTTMEHRLRRTLPLKEQYSATKTPRHKEEIFHSPIPSFACV